MPYVLSGPRWATNTVTWSFALANLPGQSAYAPLTEFFVAKAAAFRDAVVWAFNRWSEVANINFTEVSDSASAGIRLGWSSIDGAFGTAGIAFYSYDGS